MNSVDVLRAAITKAEQMTKDATLGPWWVHRDQAEVIWYGDEDLTYRLDRDPDAFTDDEWDAWAASTGQLGWGEMRRAEDAALIVALRGVVELLVVSWQHALARIESKVAHGGRPEAVWSHEHDAVALAAAFLGRAVVS